MDSRYLGDLVVEPLAQGVLEQVDALAVADRLAVLVDDVEHVVDAFAQGGDARRQYRQAQLVEQVTGRVRWRESVLWMADNGIDRFVECGAGKVLTTMLKRTTKEASGTALNTPEDLEAFAQEIKG